MGNSFNISVKPEIAAVQAKADTIYERIFAFRNTDLPAIDAKIDAIKIVIDENKVVIDSVLEASYNAAYPSDDLLLSADTERKNTGGSTFTKVKEFIVDVPGTFRVYYEKKNDDLARTAHFNIYKNGAAYGTEGDCTTTSYVTVTEDLFFSSGDLIQLYTKSDIEEDNAIVRNFRLKGVISSSNLLVTLD